MDIIFSIEEDINIKTFNLKSNILKGLNVKRLHSIENLISKFKNENLEIASNYNSDEYIFDNELYNELSSIEKNIYNTYVIDSKDIDKSKIIDILNKSEFVRYVELDGEIIAHDIPPNDPNYSQQWALPNIDSENAWEKSEGDNIVVAIIDTGVNYNNNDISENMWRNTKGHFGYDFIDNTTDPLDRNGHGTHVAGIVAASKDNSLQIAGIAPKSKIMAVKVLGDNGSGTFQGAARGIKYAVDNGAQILNNSWGSSKRLPNNRVTEDAVIYAYFNNCICVFSAGNENDNVKYYSPNNSKYVITVGAYDNNNNKAEYSNYGKGIDISAPGSYILSLSHNSNNPRVLSGTSMSAPFVSGVIALILNLNPRSTTLDSIKKRLVEFGNELDPKFKIGKRLNANNSVFTDSDGLIVIEEQLQFRATDTIRRRRNTSLCEMVDTNKIEKVLSEWVKKKEYQFPNYTVRKSGYYLTSHRANHIVIPRINGGAFPPRIRFDLRCNSHFNIRAYVELV
jgi:thermitase